MEKINIAIIDSGVKINHSSFTSDEIKGYSFISGKKSNNFNDNNGHGTAVYGIIRKTKDIANILNIKIFDKETLTSDEILIKALEYIYDNEKIDIINISAGLNICKYYKKLYNICFKLFKKGTIILSAFDNSGSIFYPAAFDCVIGVTSGKYCYTRNDIEYAENNLVNICGYGNIQRLCWTNPENIILSGNSFACANVTVEVVHLISNENGLSFNDILLKLKQKSKIYYNFKKEICCNESKINFKINKAAIFPFNKEMHSIIRFQELLKFEIVNVFDIKYSLNVGATTNHLLKQNSVFKNFTIKNIKEIEWKSIDTLILGHLDELSAAINYVDLKKELLQQAAKNNVSVYSFDDVSKIVSTINNKPNLFCPKVSGDDLPINSFGKLYRISKPVIGVWGTSSRQGKFTLQLILRKKFIEAGYNIGQVGTEPSSLLFGMDYVYPMGYNSSVLIKEFDTIRYLNHIINTLCTQEKDLIIVGSQSGTITYDVGNLGQFNILQYNFLIGTQPDCIVLCVNPYAVEAFENRQKNKATSEELRKVDYFICNNNNFQNDLYLDINFFRIDKAKVSILLPSYNNPDEMTAQVYYYAAINSNSNNKQLAYNAARALMDTAKYENIQNNIPVSKANNNEYLDKLCNINTNVVLDGAQVPAFITEKQISAIRDIAENIKSVTLCDIHTLEIVNEEIYPFVSGESQSFDECYDNIVNKLNLYINE